MCRPHPPALAVHTGSVPLATILRVFILVPVHPRVWGVRLWGDSQGGGAYAQPTTTTCIPLGGMCVWGGFGEAIGGCCEAGAADWQVCPQWLW